MKESDLIFGLLISFNKKEYQFSDIAWLTAPFKISDSSLRTNLSRMTSKGILQVRKEGRKAVYSFTTASGKISSNVSLSFKSPDWSDWNNNWWGISFSLPEIKKSERYKIKKKLSVHRFAALHPGLWIRPVNLKEKIEEKLKNIFENKNCKVISFSFYSKAELDKIPYLWRINKINNKFKESLKYIDDWSKKTDLSNPKEALIGKMTVGNNIVKQLFSDPLLPDQFLPKDWCGKKLRKAFFEWDKLTTEKSKPYWKKIFINK